MRGNRQLKKVSKAYITSKGNKPYKELLRGKRERNKIGGRER